MVRKLADGSVRVHWYHRATKTALAQDPTTAAGLIEVDALDKGVAKIEAAARFASGTYAALWVAYTAKDSPAWTGLKPRTRSDYQKVRDWLGPAAEAMVVAAVSPPQIEKLRDKAVAEKGRRFGNYVVQVLRLTWTWAKARGLAKVNPLAETKAARKPRGSPHANRAWKLHEVEAYMTDCPFQLLVPFALGLFASMREGDALRVTWAAHKHNQGVIDWMASKNDEDCKARVEGLFLEILDAARARRPLEPAAVQICVNSYGSPWTESGFRASFFKRLRKLRDAGAIEPGCTFHGLRSTVATMAREMGESESRVSAAIGDRSTQMAALYGRSVDRLAAQGEVLLSVQKRFGNIQWQRSAE